MEKTFSLNGIRFNISYSPDLDWLASYFCVNTEPIETGWMIDSKVEKVKDFAAPSLSDKFSNTIFRSQGRMFYLFDSDLMIAINKVTPSLISSTIQVRQRCGLKHRLKGALTKQFRLNDNNLTVQAFRHAILYPYFVLLHKKHQVSFSHGCAFVIDGRCYAIIGFDAVGKSTIAALAKTHGAELLTDNFVVHDHTYLYFVPDPLRQAHTSCHHYYGKRFEKIGFACDKVPIVGFIFTYLGQQYTFHKSTRMSIQRLNNMFYSYLPEYYDFGRYTAVIALTNAETAIIPHVGEADTEADLYECQRASLQDNKRLLDDVLSI